MKWIVYRDNALCDVFENTSKIFEKYEDHIEMRKRSFQTKLSDAKRNNEPFKFGMFTAEYCEITEVITVFKSSDGFKTNVYEL